MDLQTKFRARFGGTPRLYRAPGRVNLIGEHTDYNEGFVMPAAIHLSCRVAAAPRADRRIVVYSENLDESAVGDLSQLAPKGNWSDYPLGVAAMLQEKGRQLPGANLYIASDVPLGAGLSSSAAIEVSVAMALTDLSGVSIDRKEMALLCQRAENEFAGARCGIMDQFIACHGRSGSAILLDCRSLDFRLLPVPDGARLVLCNTMVKHAIAAGEYNARRAQCDEAVRSLPNAKGLRDVSCRELEQLEQMLTPLLYRRARHVITENQRVLDGAAALEAADLTAFGRLMQQSHASLRDDYEVSCPELDLMVEIAARQRGVWGARMTGGGFGGCTINLVQSDAVGAFQENISRDYLAATGVKPEIWITDPSEGAEAMS